MKTCKGIRCPKCESVTRVTNTLKTQRGIVRRHRKCQSLTCKFRFATSEKLSQKN